MNKVIHDDSDDMDRLIAVFALTTGILRFLDKPENGWLKVCFTNNPAWAVHQQAIPDMLYEKMDAEHWQDADDYWDDAIYLVCCQLCRQDE